MAVSSKATAASTPGSHLGDAVGLTDDDLLEMYRLVALARAVAYGPSLLLMDEPLGALDRKLREEMQLELQTIQRELGVTTLYVTHDQQEALALSDRIAIMNHGDLVQIGSPVELYESPADDFVAGFLGDVNLLEAVATVDGGLIRIAVGPPGSDDHKVIQAMAEAFARESRTVRLSPITTDGAIEALALLGAGKADLAVGRGDLEMPADAQTIAIVRKNFVVLWSPSGFAGKSSKRKPTPKIKEIVPLAELDHIVFGGWDIFEENSYQAARTAGVLETSLRCCLERRGWLRSRIFAPDGRTLLADVGALGA